MHPKVARPRRPEFAPAVVGVLLLAAPLLLSSCKEHPPRTTPETPAASSKAHSAHRKKPARHASPAESDAPATLRFIAYNLENWLTMERDVGGQLKATPKPESEKSACIRLLAAAKPDVLGICEIGSRDDAAEVRSRLKAAGIDLPHLHFTGGADDVRHLALLSRFPLTAHDPGRLTYRIETLEFGMQRGILDASLAIDGSSFRFLGVHLKSKREVVAGDQEQMRRNESHLLRRHVENLLAADPEARLVVYGDFNDTRHSAVIRGVQGPYNSPLFLTALPLADAQGDRWTHHWAYEDVYSRFDYIMVSQPLKREADFKASRILDDSDWNEASDHRAVLAVFR